MVFCECRVFGISVTVLFFVFTFLSSIRIKPCRILPCGRLHKGFLSVFTHILITHYSYPLKTMTPGGVKRQDRFTFFLLNLKCSKLGKFSIAPIYLHIFKICSSRLNFRKYSFLKYNFENWTTLILSNICSVENV